MEPARNNKYFEIMNDPRLERRLKRRRISLEEIEKKRVNSEAIVKKKSRFLTEEKVEYKDIKEFKNELLHSTDHAIILIENTRDVVKKIANSLKDKNECDFKDLQYDRFLKSLGKEGKSYVFSTVLSSGVLSVKYEEDELLESDPLCNVDEDFKLYLAMIKKESCSFIIDDRRHEPIHYEEDDDDRSSDSDLIIIGDHLHCNEDTPFVPSKEYDSSCFEDVEILGENMSGTPGSNSQFRKELLDILKSPYDHEEYETLMQQISCRKKKVAERETRQGRTRPYPLDQVGKSYLDYYENLAMKIEQCSETSSILFLLRGFFYWLQNMLKSGSFRPWLDKECLDMLGCL